MDVFDTPLQKGNAIYAIIPEEGGDVTILQQSAVVNEQKARSITLQDKPDVEVLEKQDLAFKRGTCMGSQLSMNNQTYWLFFIFQRNGGMD